MSKRAAGRQITQESLDREDEPEDAGQFERASQSELEGRVLKKARRTRATGEGSSNDQSEPGRGLFAGIRLTGLLNQQNGLPQSKPLQLVTLPTASEAVSSTAGLTSVSVATSNTVAKPTFLTELRSLNFSVSDWIVKHVRENPYVDLTPIFRDYEKHLRELDQKFGNPSQDGGKEEESEVVATSDSAGGGKEEQETAEGGKADEDEGKEDEEETATSGLQISPAAEKEEGEALLSVRAKLFFKRSSDTEFCELGLGQLQVLPGNGEEVKVVMRNDTSLAKVLLNVRVTSALPVSCKRNNVLLVCAPNPPLEKNAASGENENAPVTYLIRVKTATMATELQKALQCSSGDQ
ncbi:Nuclear pore complex protein Nup50 [Geodia barretti]|uniref:Nuclear pore complex protein Nup50 n=1 Tax=Geodia barretti TaxID=519541 RepID=A0AA35S7M4_GEOBA|nr:Nuclear pore complex protein Nup50 [Geodia barretti]